MNDSASVFINYYKVALERLLANAPNIPTFTKYLTAFNQSN
jgi:hypothetical protein